MRPIILRSVPQYTSFATAGTRLARNTIRRGYASEAPGDISKTETTRPVSTNPAGGSKLPFVLGGAVLFLVVAGRYILASDKPARSEHAAQQALRREGVITNRDPRDSGVKTLEQKRQKEQDS